MKLQIYRTEKKLRWKKFENVENLRKFNLSAFTYATHSTYVQDNIRKWSSQYTKWYCSAILSTTEVNVDAWIGRVVPVRTNLSPVCHWNVCLCNCLANLVALSEDIRWWTHSNSVKIVKICSYLKIFKDIWISTKTNLLDLSIVNVFYAVFHRFLIDKMAVRIYCKSYKLCQILVTQHLDNIKCHRVFQWGIVLHVLSRSIAAIRQRFEHIFWKYQMQETPNSLSITWK